jgi:two-component system LytT family response regulator
MLLLEQPGITGILEARDGKEAVRAILDKQPDLVFLDVQMPEMDGFAVVQQVGAERMPAVVFVTAHDRYAIRAFEINAIDYLLKPVTAERFRLSLDRARTRLNTMEPGDTSRLIVSLLETIASPTRHVRRLAVQSGGKTLLISVEDVDWIEAAENYVQLHAGRASHMLHVTMNSLEKSLNPEMFLRIHRSIIVNLTRIKELQPAGHGEYAIVLHNNVRLESGRTYHDRIKALTTNPF